MRIHRWQDIRQKNLSSETLDRIEQEVRVEVERIQSVRSGDVDRKNGRGKP